MSAYGASTSATSCCQPHWLIKHRYDCLPQVPNFRLRICSCLLPASLAHETCIVAHGVKTCLGVVVPALLSSTARLQTPDLQLLAAGPSCPRKECIVAHGVKRVRVLWSQRCLPQLPHFGLRICSCLLPAKVAQGKCIIVYGARLPKVSECCSPDAAFLNCQSSKLQLLAAGSSRPRKECIVAQGVRVKLRRVRVLWSQTCLPQLTDFRFQICRCLLPAQGAQGEVHSCS